MKGNVIWNSSVPVTQTTKGILALSVKTKKPAASPCIHCGKCVEVCPRYLVPVTLSRSVEKGDWNTAKRFDLELCSECGCCSYVCPASLPLLQTLQEGKKLLALQASEKGDA